VTVWVIDTSPLLFLAKLGHLELLRKSAETICIPQAVLDEVQMKPDSASEMIGNATEDWSSVCKVASQQSVEFLLADLDLGEAEVIALAKEVDAQRVVMDDLDARRFARRVGLQPVGTLGILLAARLRDEILSVKQEIERLESLGFRASIALVEAILHETGE
jgi:hypothetical protein